MLFVVLSSRAKKQHERISVPDTPTLKVITKSQSPTTKVNKENERQSSTVDGNYVLSPLSIFCSVICMREIQIDNDNIFLC